MGSCGTVPEGAGVERRGRKAEGLTSGGISRRALEKRVGPLRALAEAPLGELLAAWQGGFGCRSFEAYQRLVGFLGFVHEIIRTALADQPGRVFFWGQTRWLSWSSSMI